MNVPANLPHKLSLLYVVACLAGFVSCKEPIEGCKDITATNWDASADDPCEDCCVYPELEISFEHVAGDTTLIYGNFHNDDFGNVFFLTSIRYYLSEFQLSNTQRAYYAADSIDLTISDGVATQDVRLKDDVIFVTRGSNTLSIGQFATEGQQIDSLSFNIGLANPVNQAIPASLPAGHPLAPQPDSMYWDATRGYIFQRIGIVPDTMAMDTIILEIGGSDFLRTAALSYDAVITAGENVVVPLKVDYLTWFKGINFAEESEAVWKEKIVSNLPNSFSIAQ